MKTILEFIHSPKGEKNSGINLQFHDYGLEETIKTIKKDRQYKNCKLSSFEATGTGRYFSFRQYDIKRKTSFVSVISDPCLCLSIRCGEGAVLKFKNSEMSHSIYGCETFAFWQDNEHFEQTLKKGNHYYIDLYMRPSSIIHLEDKEVISKLLNRSAGWPSEIIRLGPDIQERVDAFLSEFFMELDQELDLERFDYLCDCLLLLATGEKIEIMPPKFEDIKVIRYTPTTDEERFFNKLKRYDHGILLKKFHAYYQRVKSMRKRFMKEAELAKLVQRVCRELLADPRSALAEVYFKIARIFLDAERTSQSKEDKAEFRKALLMAFRLSFRAYLPSQDDMIFFCELRLYKHDSRGYDYWEVHRLHEQLFENSYNFDTKINNKVRGQQIYSDIGPIFLEQNLTSGNRNRNAKPLEIIRLYDRLIEYFSQTTDLAPHLQINTGAIISELNIAYENENFLQLMQVEMEQFGHLPNFIEGMDEETLRWYITALFFEKPLYDRGLENFENKSEFAELRLYHALGNDEDNFRLEIKKEADKINKKVMEFNSILDKRPDNVYSRQQLFEFVNIIRQDIDFELLHFNNLKIK